MKLFDHHQYCCRCLWPNHNSMRLFSCFCFYIPSSSSIITSMCVSQIVVDLSRTCGQPRSRRSSRRTTSSCKNPALVTASDFKSSELNHAGNTDNFLQSLVTLVTAAEDSGINTRGLSIAGTDLAVGGLVLPHSHPRSEMLQVYSGIVIAGFIDSRGTLFQNYRRAGDTVVFPRGLLHFCLNGGFELATAFSVLNNQNPGLVRVADAMFSPEDHVAVEDTHVNHAFSFSWEWNDGTLPVAVGN